MWLSGEWQMFVYVLEHRTFSFCIAGFESLSVLPMSG